MPRKKPIADLIQGYDVGDCVRIRISYLGRDASRPTGASKLITERYLQVQPPAMDGEGNPLEGARKGVLFLSGGQAKAKCTKENTHPVAIERYAGYHQARVAGSFDMVLAMQLLQPPAEIGEEVPAEIPGAVGGGGGGGGEKIKIYKA